MSDRCKGHCCSNVVTDHSPEWMAEQYQFWLNVGSPEGMDIGIVYPAWEYQGERHLHLQDGTLAGTSHIYRCRHLTSEGDCGIYETRPRLCRAYPHEVYMRKGCTDPDCAWTERKAAVVFQWGPWE